jgi:hypothetical protein
MHESMLLRRESELREREKALEEGKADLARRTAEQRTRDKATTDDHNVGHCVCSPHAPSAQFLLAASALPVSPATRSPNLKLTFSRHPSRFYARASEQCKSYGHKPQRWRPRRWSCWRWTAGCVSKAPGWTR